MFFRVHQETFFVTFHEKKCEVEAVCGSLPLGPKFCTYFLPVLPVERLQFFCSSSYWWELELAGCPRCDHLPLDRLNFPMWHHKGLEVKEELGGVWMEGVGGWGGGVTFESSLHACQWFWCGGWLNCKSAVVSPEIISFPQNFYLLIIFEFPSKMFISCRKFRKSWCDITSRAPPCCFLIGWLSLVRAKHHLLQSGLFVFFFLLLFFF